MALVSFAINANAIELSCFKCTYNSNAFSEDAQAQEATAEKISRHVRLCNSIPNEYGILKGGRSLCCAISEAFETL